MTNLGPAHSEPGPSQAPVQDVDAETHLSMHPSLRLVCSDRPEGRLLPCLDPPSTQTVLRFAFEGRAYQYKALPFGLSLPSLEHCCANTEHHIPVTSAGWGFRSTGERANSPLRRGSLSRHGVGLGQPHSMSLKVARSVNAEMPGVFPAQEGGSTETFLEAPGAYGILNHGHVTRIASYETASALASRPGPEMGMAPQHVPGLSHPVLPPHLQPMVGPCFLRAGVPLEQVSRYIVVQQMPLPRAGGGHVQRACSCGALDRVPAAVAYQLPRVAGSMACSAPLQNAATREACTGPYGQHCDRCVHQPPRQSTLPSHVVTRLPSPPLESEASEVASRRSCPRRAQSCSRRALMSARPSRSMATPPRGTPADFLRRFGDAQVDLFASPDTSHCQLFFSLSEGTLGTDVLACSWPWGLRKYSFPPVSLLAQTLCKVREDEEQVFLVAPYWSNRTWFPELMLLATAPPWQIPLRRDLLSQRRGTLWHPRP